MRVAPSRTKTPLDLPASKAVVASIGRTVGYPPIELPIVGASSGMADVVDQLHIPMAGVSIANYDDNQHAENESLRLGNPGTESKSTQVCWRI